MKIAVVGCGAVGSYYGAMLCRAGREVHFLLRSDFEAVHQKGVTIRSPAGNFTIHPHCAKTPEAIGLSDLVLIGLKTTANDQFPKLLPPLVGPQTAVATLQNGLGNTEQLARLFSPEQILSGLCFVCLNRVEPGVIHHLEYGMIMLGEFQCRAGPRTHGLAAMFHDAGVPCKVTDNLAPAQLPSANSHLPSVGPVLTTDKLLADPRWEKLLRDLMLEVIAAAGALGFEIFSPFPIGR